MNLHRVSACMVIALFVSPIATFAAGEHGAHSQTQRMSSAQSVVDYIYIDGFELPVDCTPVLTCPIPPNGKACISGRLTDAGTSAQLRALFKADKTCGGGAVGGPCDLALSAYDAVQFVSNPGTSPLLAGTEKLVDGCGRFRFSGIDPPLSGTVAIVADDADLAPESDLRVVTATFHALGPNQHVDGVNALVARRDTVNSWTLSAGSPFGAATSFADVGAILFSFSAGGVPQAGVSVVRNGIPSPGNDYYFSDAVPTQRLQVDTVLVNTGVNGAALFAAGDYANYSGAGGPMGCVWPAVPAASAIGVVLFVEIDC